MAKTLPDQATELIAYHKELKEAGMTDHLVHELVAIAARGIANGTS